MSDTIAQSQADHADVSVDDVERVSAQMAAAKAGVEKVILGQSEVVEESLITLLAGGHVLLIGVPGLAKTKLVQTLGAVLGLEDKRVQFTPDLMPADILGSEILEEGEDGKRFFRFVRGPVFSQLLMADEINRASPRTQSALLQAMQERRVSIAGQNHDLPQPFHVLATQNPIEQEGTYPLPEAQQDRFMFKVYVEYPSFDEEFEVARRTTGTATGKVNPVLGAEEILRLQRLVRQVPVSDHVVRYALSLVRQTRVGSDGVPDFVDDLVGWGAGPRAVQFLILGGKARALLQGRFHVQVEDIQALAKPVLRHRMVVNFAAESDGITSDEVVERIIAATPTTEDELSRDARFQKIFAS